MNRLISKIEQHVIDKMNIDNIKYNPYFSYLESPYASMDFPELGDLNLFKILAEPKANSSSVTKNELEQVVKASNNRTEKEIKHVLDVDKDPLLIYYPFLNKHNLELDRPLFATIYYSCMIAIVDHLKYFYNRARPFQIAPYYDMYINRIITSSHHTASYPSGHAMYAALASNMLSEKYPKYKSDFERILNLCAEARVLQGVHFPSDNEAAITVVNKIYPNMKNYITEN